MPLDVSAKPPTPLSIFRAAVKAQIAHELAVRRQAEREELEERGAQQVLALLIALLLALLALLQSTRNASAPAHSRY